jgi:sugar lactone lactonase YvrE
MYSKDCLNRNWTSRASALLTLTALAMLTLGGTAVRVLAQNPAVVFSKTGGVSGIGGSAGVIDYSGTVAHIAANSRGDVFANVSANNGAYILEQPVNGGAQVELVSGLGSTYGGHSIYVDANNNIYAPDTGDAQIIYIPFVNGSYPANVVRSTLSNCSAFPVPATTTVSCYVPLGYPGNLGYYVQSGDVALDSAGNLYILDKYTGGNFYGGVDVLIQVSATTGQFTLLSTTLGNDASAQIAVNGVGDVFVVDYGSVTLFPHTNYNSSTGLGNLNGPVGVSMDKSGNLFITQSSAANIIEYPYVGGSYDLNNPFIVSNQLGSPYTGKASQGIAIDGFARITYAGDYPNSISSLTVGSLSFGAQALNVTSAAQTLNLVFNSPANFGKFIVSGPAGTFATTASTCANGAAIAIAQNCTVSLTYTSTAAGAQTGQLLAYDNSGKLLGSARLSGVGQASLLNVDPGTVAATGSAFKAPASVATDNAGNVYVADSSTGSIYKTAAGTATATAVATGFTSPSAVTVDGAGNLYVADSASTQIFELPFIPATSSYGTKVVLATGLNRPSGIALDGTGNLYVADTGNGRVLRLASSGNLPLGSLVTTFGSGFTKPVALAVDNTGQNVYVSDSGKVIQVGIYSSTQTTVLSGLTTSAGVAVDPAGDLFAVDSGAATITRLPFINGGVNKNFLTVLPAIVKAPSAIALDNSGNLYVTDITNAVAATSQRSAGLLNYGNVNVSATSSTVSAQISDGGNAGFVFSTPPYKQSGSTSSFSAQASSTCTAAAALSSGQSCTLAANFTPLARGVQSDTLTFSSTAANASSLILTGSGTQLTTSTLALSVTSPATPPTYGRTVVVQAALTPQAGGIGTPSGTVTFYLDTVPQAPVTISGNAASFSFVGLTGGQHAITASYSGDSNYAYSASSPLAVTVGTSTTVTVLTITPPSNQYTNPTSANLGQTVTFTAVVSPSLPGTPTGTVTFFNGTTNLGTANVLPQGPQAAYGAATLTLTTLALGQYNIAAVYNGDPNYSGSTSIQTVALLISYPTIGTSASTLNIVGGGAPVTITFASIAGFGASGGTGTGSPNTVSLTCAGLPQYATCSFQPAYAVVEPGTPVNVLMSVVINQPPVIAPGSASIGTLPTRPGSVSLKGILLSVLLLPPLLFGRRGTRKGILALRGSTVLACLLLSACFAALSGCGTSTGAAFTTPKGTSKFTVTATIASNPVAPNPPPAQTLTFNLTVN